MDTPTLILPEEGPPWMRERLGVFEAARMAQAWADALLAILATPWHGDALGPERFCPCCFAPSVDCANHRRGCAWLIAAKACGVA